MSSVLSSATTSQIISGYLLLNQSLSDTVTCEDYDNNTDRKAITSVKVCVNSGAAVGLVLDFTDYSTAGWRGSNSGTVYTFDLGDSEDITTISYNIQDDQLLGLSFTTSRGRQSPWYGTKSLSSAAMTWSFGGCALGGFYGTADTVLRGLAVRRCFISGICGFVYISPMKPTWTTRLGETWLYEMTKRVQQLMASVKDSEVYVGQLQERASASKMQSDTGLGERAQKVVDSIVATGRSIEHMHNLVSANRKMHSMGDEDRCSNLHAQAEQAEAAADEIKSALKNLFDECNLLHTERVKFSDEVDAAYLRAQRDTTMPCRLFLHRP
ncbi:uncharacterized protein PHACADRAFT_179725 [Phanerochaete carnosa HHB-10118-sp]|uniref:Jacalin-type lectin domain-containing protein n=1 Tax=Phanerochaete carnosa (strain HHB-10118-sp) TaxID=650164 RepID=K5XBS9_PHACS|nr:uncharacterized protein PHACADRAFT_179725 [Phanerochaete carnosa HHB-10118-sp]EKM60422.1 hypothetical protein PHACADRAFT_179725 [Phanerochaete carnosa HHB-10118-sp]